MDNRFRAWLEDIEQSINEIFDFIPPNRNFHTYQTDIKTKKAVERNLEIIGEAVNRIIKYKESSLKIENSQKIVDTRNRIIHEYDAISDEIIWTIVLQELPLLKIEI